MNWSSVTWWTLIGVLVSVTMPSVAAPREGLPWRVRGARALLGRPARARVRGGAHRRRRIGISLASRGPVALRIAVCVPAPRRSRSRAPSDAEPSCHGCSVAAESIGGGLSHASLRADGHPRSRDRREDRRPLARQVPVSYTH